jgi:anti-anti-sigma regulatory factor
MSTTIDYSASPPDSLISGAKKIVFAQDATIADQLCIAEDELDETDIWLDFANIEVINSAELSALIRFSLRMRQPERSVYMCHVGAQVAETFEITRFAAFTSQAT